MTNTDDGALIAEYTQYVGMSLGDLNIAAGVRPGPKQYRRLIIDATMRAVSGLWDRNYQRIKVVTVDDERLPHEAVSFPTFQVADLIAEIWPACTLIEQVESILFLPIGGPRGLEHADSGILLEPVSWTPTAAQLAGIEEEWRMFQEAMRVDPTDLPPPSSTAYIHIRPHAADSDDTDSTAAGAVAPVRSSFWLDREFVQAIL